MNIDMSGGNPIPFVGSARLDLQRRRRLWTTRWGSHALNIFGTLPTGPFASETHNANDHGVFPQVGQYGSIFFDDGQGAFTQPDEPQLHGPSADHRHDPGDRLHLQRLCRRPVVQRPRHRAVLGGFRHVEFANTPFAPPPTFETTNVANKTTFVTFNTPGPTAGIIGIVDVPTASTGLCSP